MNSARTQTLRTFSHTTRPTRRLSTPAALFVAAMCCLSALARSPESTAPTPRQLTDGVVVLNTGGVLRGNVTQDADGSLTVRTPGGVLLRFARDEYEAAAPDLEGAYAQLAARADPGVVGDQLRLVHWLIDRRMLADAANHLELATALAPNDPRLPPTRRRLAAAQQMAAQRRDESSAKTDDDTGSVAAAEPPAAIPATLDEDLLHDSAPLGDSVQPGDRRQLTCPPVLMDAFVRSAQPLLLNRCGAGGCHGNPQCAMPLIGPRSGRPATRVESTANLRQVLQQVMNPAGDSPLLRYAQTAHGGARRPPLSQIDADASQTLSLWINAIKSANGLGRATSDANPVRPVAYEAPLPVPPPGDPTGMEHAEGRSDPPGETDPGNTDPYDPARFNRLWQDPPPERPTP
jgi:hypothetical protein